MSDVVDLGPFPWDQETLERVLPHRAPFLLVDQIESIADERVVVGTRTWSQAEARVHAADGSRAVPASYLTECMAQIGAVLVLARPENRGRPIFFMRIERVSIHSPVRPGDTLRVEATVQKLRSRTGTLVGRARIGDRRVAEGTMTFALADRSDAT